MGATQSRPRETREEIAVAVVVVGLGVAVAVRHGVAEIAVAVAVVVVGLGVAVAAAAAAVRLGVAAAVAAVRLGVAAWNAMRSLASSSSPSPLQHRQKRTFEFRVDASIKEDLQDPYMTKKAGSGGVLRNEKGEFLCKFYEHLGKEEDITAAELTAIKGALEVFPKAVPRWDGQYDQLIVKNDNATAVRLAKGKQDPYNDEISDLVDEIKTLVSAEFEKIDREDNLEADALADDGWKHSGPRVVSYNQSF